MTNEIQIFSSPEFGKIRTLEEDGKILFCGKDVAAALGYVNPRKAITDHCKGVTKRYTLTAGGQQELSFIPEGDVYRLICGSKLPGAEKFERWVFDEVLPAIRQTGSYRCADTDAKSTEDYMKAAQIVGGCKEDRLPYVLHLLTKAGFDLNSVDVSDEDRIKRIERELQDELVTILQRYSVKELAEKLPWSMSTICYWRRGICKPKFLRHTLEVVRSTMEG